MNWVSGVNCYRPPTKLREDKVFTGVCLSTGGLVSRPFGGGVGYLGGAEE